MHVKNLVVFKKIGKGVVNCRLIVSYMHNLIVHVHM